MGARERAEDARFLTRRGFCGIAGFASLGVLAACTGSPSEGPCGKGAEGEELIGADIECELIPLPDAFPDPADSFGIDRSINMTTIDRYLGRSDVAYRDVRMLEDPADFAAIGGNPVLDRTLEGFRIVPFPSLGCMPLLAVAGAYGGPSLFDVEWGSDNRTVISARPLYQEALAILDELFPKHKAVFLMCGGGGYASLTRALLIHLGWDERRVYNIGGNWDYCGARGLSLVSYDSDGQPSFRRWRADYALIEFDYLRGVDGRAEGSRGGAGEAPKGAPAQPPRGTRGCIVA